MKCYSLYNSMLGKIAIVAQDDAIVGIYLPGTKGAQKLQNIVQNDQNIAIKTAKTWLNDYFAGKNPSINKLKIKLSGTPFQKDVWNMLLNIKCGTVKTYGDIAKELAQKYGIKKMSAQAVGTAIGKNPIAIVVPCHRVVGASSVGGYAGGIDKKIALLMHEGINCNPEIS